MRILLVAYEFAPSASPQSLRWQYLCAELSAIGHEIRVLAPDSPEYHSEGLPYLPPNVEVCRTFAGPFHGFLRSRQVRKELYGKSQAVRARAVEGKETCVAAPSDVGQLAPSCSVESSESNRALAEELNWKGKLWHAGLNWKGRVFRIIQSVAGFIIYPDLRGEWMPWARCRLDSELKSYRPDVVITSHEPATSLYLGIHAKKQGYRWVADLGDPVCAPYTPNRWRERALRLEREVCRLADLITVTADSVCALMENRHARDRGFLVIPQGFNSRIAVDAVDNRLVRDRLELLYTGSFYKFRAPDELIAAVISNPSVRLTVATINPPEYLRIASRDHPGSIRLIGFLPHMHALEMQRGADILVNIGNELPDQVPGKVYEYLGAGKPILHLSSGVDIGTLSVLECTGRAIIVSNDRQSISCVLDDLVGCDDFSKKFDLDMSPARVEGFSWSASAQRLSAAL